MIELLHLKYKTYSLKGIAIENIITEFYGKIAPDKEQLPNLIAIEFDDIVIDNKDSVIISSGAEIIDGRVLSSMFLDAMTSFKKPAKKKPEDNK